VVKTDVAHDESQQRY